MAESPKPSKSSNTSCGRGDALRRVDTARGRTSLFEYLTHYISTWGGDAAYFVGANHLPPLPPAEAMHAALRSSADAGFAMRRIPGEPRGKILGGRDEIETEFAAGSILQFRRLELFLPPGDELVAFADELSKCLDRDLLSITAFEAPKEGSAIPPHVDETVVLTFQLHGLRRWEIGDRFDPNEARLLGEGEWTPRAHVVLEPAMAIYVPPGTAHHVAGLGPTSSTALIFDGRARRPI
jgi:hypothetical protein